MLASVLLDMISMGGFDHAFAKLYGKQSTGIQKARYSKLVTNFLSLYGNLDVSVFSVPGRSEIIGNHTDHQNGRVIACAVDIDIIAIAAATGDNYVKVKSEGYREEKINLKTISVEKAKKGSSDSLIAGITHYFRNKGYNAGGFCACTTSEVLSGSGLSSSAAFEVLIGYIFNTFYNKNEISAIEIARASQYAENVFFGKPCGLMDQTACAVGGFAYIDFADNDRPLVEKLDFKLPGYSICIVNTGGNHADLTDEYSAVPAEMKKIAAFFKMETLRGLTIEKLIKNTASLRDKFGDRAFLRAVHFIKENDRVSKQADNIKKNNVDNFLKLITESGDSSFKYLQNVYTNKNVVKQNISVALAISEHFGAVCRVHGGGFAGTIQAFVKNEVCAEYSKLMNQIFSNNACMVLSVRSYGAVELRENKIIEGEQIHNV